MNVKKLLACLACATSAALVPSARAAETIAYFPLDADARSVAYADRNADVVLTLLEPGYAHEIAYETAVKSACVMDGVGAVVRPENAGCLKLAYARLAIDLSRFPLSNDVETVTVEMFVKGGKELGSYFPFFALAPFADDELGKNGPLQSPQVNVVPSGDGKVLAYVRAESASGQEVFANGDALLDGEWHHVAIVLRPNATGGTKALWYRDYRLVSSHDHPRRWKGGAGLDGRDPLRLVLGSRRGTIFLDEIRMTAGELGQEAWLRQHASAAPVDGETLLYLPFDGDCRSLAHEADNADATWSGGEAVFADDIGTRKALRDGERKFVRAPNLSSLSCRKTRFYWQPSYWAFCSNTCQSATIEFFYRGSPDPEEVADANPVFRIGNGVTSGRFMLMSYSAAAQGFDHRAYLSVRDRTGVNDGEHAASVVCGPDGVMCDGKWHHVALTTETTEDGAKGLVRIYFDYTLVKEATLAEPWCAIDPGLVGDSFNLGSLSGVCSLDELRITKGALPPEKFLRRFSTDGALLIIR